MDSITSVMHLANLNVYSQDFSIVPCISVGIHSFVKAMYITKDGGGGGQAPLAQY